MNIPPLAANSSAHHYPPAIVPSPLTILVVDDDDAIRKLLVACAESLGHRAVVAADGVEALAVFACEQPDLVLMDLMMPAMDGFHATQQLKQMVGPKRWVPIVVLTAVTDPADLARALHAGADDYFLKPVDSALLLFKLQYLQHLLATHRAVIQHAKYQLMVDSVVEGLVLTDMHGTIMNFNQAAEHMFGYRAHEIIGQSVATLMPAAEARRHGAHIANYRATGETTIMGKGRELQGRRKNGSEFPIAIALSEFDWQGSKHLIASLSDITERKAREREREAQHAQLAQYHLLTEEEKQIAQDLMEKIVRRSGLDDPLLSYLIQPSEDFSGDVIAAQRAPDGQLYVLLADATGHGLTAAISLLPVVGIFYAMVDKGFPLVVVISEMNKRLHEMMPVGRFLAAHIAVIDEAARSLQLWNGGMPPMLLTEENGETVTLHSHHLALGILGTQQFEAQVQTLRWEKPGHLVLYSDGLIEAQNPDGEMFEVERLKFIIAQNSAHPIEPVRHALNRHLNGHAAHDDISIAVIRLP